MTPNENHSLSEQIAERTCKFCNAAFTSPGMTIRHERACAGRTPEQRHKATWARDHFRSHYSVKAKQPKVEKPDQPVINADAARLRRLRESDRERMRRFRAKHARKRNGTDKLVDTGFRTSLSGRLEREVKKASIMLSGQRVQITLSLDWETARQLLIQLIPDIAIDGVTLK